MEDFTKSSANAEGAKVKKFGFAVASTNARPAKTGTPELHVTVTKDKFRINQAAARILNIVSGDRLMFISNEAAVRMAVIDGELNEEDVEANIVFAIAKGVPALKKGNIQFGPKRLTKAEEVALADKTYIGDVDENGRPIEVMYKGFKVASTNGSTDPGQIVEGSDALNYIPLKGNAERTAIWELDVEGKFDMEVEGLNVPCYPMTFDRYEDKILRNKSEAAEGEAIEDENEVGNGDAVTNDSFVK